MSPLKKRAALTKRSINVTLPLRESTTLRVVTAALRRRVGTLRVVTAALRRRDTRVVEGGIPTLVVVGVPTLVVG